MVFTADDSLTVTTCALTDHIRSAKRPVSIHPGAYRSLTGATSSGWQLNVANNFRFSRFDPSNRWPLVGNSMEHREAFV